MTVDRTGRRHDIRGRFATGGGLSSSPKALPEPDVCEKYHAACDRYGTKVYDGTKAAVDSDMREIEKRTRIIVDTVHRFRQLGVNVEADSYEDGEATLHFKYPPIGNCKLGFGFGDFQDEIRFRFDSDDPRDGWVNAGSEESGGDDPSRETAEDLAKTIINHSDLLFDEYALPNIRRQSHEEVR